MTTTNVAGEPAPGSKVRLVLLSFLMLFVELGLIRWAGAYNVYLSFFTNFILLASFLGVGVGFLRAKGRFDLFRLAPLALAALFVFLAVFPVQGGRVEGVLQVVGGFGWPALPKWLSLSVVFALSFLVMAAIASGVARVFARFESLEAYRLDILGSILGIVGFSALAFLQASPLVWGLVVAAALVALSGRRRIVDLAAIVVVIGVLAVLSFAPLTHWSPVSTDHHLAAGRRRHRDRRQRPSASTDHVGVLHGDRAGVPLRAVRAFTREPAHGTC